MRKRTGRGGTLGAAAGRALVVALALAAACVGVTATEARLAPPAPALAGNRAPYHLVFSSDGRRAYVTEWAEGSVVVIDALAGRVVAHRATGGRAPTGLAITSDGSTLVVTNSGDGSVALIDLRGGAGPPMRLPLLGMPFDGALSLDGATAYVAVSQLDRVAVLDLHVHRWVGSIPVGGRPRALAITPDGTTLVCANMSGSVSVIDPAQRREVARVRIPAVNLRGIAVSADGRHAYVTGQRAQNERPTETAVGIWSNQLFGMSLGGARPRVDENLWLDMAGEGVADPDAVVLGRDGLAYLSFSGSHAVGALRPDGAVELAARGTPEAGPRGLALTPDGRQLWVANHLGNSLAVLDARTLATVRTIPLGRASHVDPSLYGRYLFESAFLAKGGQFSCNSCHPDGRSDGISWKFVHVKDGVEERNARSLLGNLAATAPFRWSGHDPDLPTFVRSEVTGLLQGPPLADRELKAMVRFLSSLPLPPNPYRGPGGALTLAAARGRALFQGKADCGDCHAGPQLGGTGRRAWVGTTRPDLLLDVPHLAGVYDSAPYLHDGRAATLEEVFTQYDPEGHHGRAHALSTEELHDLIEFVREQ